MDESSIKVRKSQEPLKFFDGSCNRPIPDGLYLPLVHLDTTVVYDVANELHWGLMEGAFFGFEEQVEISQALQDLRNVMAMFGHAPGVDNNLINYRLYLVGGGSRELELMTEIPVKEVPGWLLLMV